MSRIEKLAATLNVVARPGRKPKEVIAEVRRQHPKASKKDVVRAAFYVLTEAGTLDESKSQALHELAISQRAPGDDKEGLSN